MAADSASPLTIVLAHAITRLMNSACREGTIPWLLPDTKTQVTVEYIEKHGLTMPLRVHTIVLTAQHTPFVNVDDLRKIILETVIRKAVPARYLDERTVYHVRTFIIFDQLVR